MPNEYDDILSHAYDEEWLVRQLLYSGWMVRDDKEKGIIQFTQKDQSITDGFYVIVFDGKVCFDEIGYTNNTKEIDYSFDAIELLLFSLYSKLVQRRCQK